MRIISRIIALGTLLVLAACGTFTAGNYIDNTLPAGSDFNSCLAAEYQDRASSEAYVDCNWAGSVMFVERSMAAAAGETVQPLDPSNHGVLASDLGELQSARADLVDALDGGGRDGQTACKCAEAQRYYDGWVEQASDNTLGVGGSVFGGEGGPVQPDRVDSEKVAFYEALQDCKYIRHRDDYVVYFGFDLFNLTSAARAVLDELASVVQDFIDPIVAVVGHTDTSGSSAYNDALADRRADAVKHALADSGVDSSAAGLGENSPAVDTGDGVREPLNRRVEITAIGLEPAF